MNGVGIFFLVLVFLVILPAGGWVAFTYFRAKRAGLPPPPISAYNPFKRSSSSNYPITPRPNNLWNNIVDKFSMLRPSNRGSRGDYVNTHEPHTGYRGADEGAWDTRVEGREGEYEGYGEYEEQELGLHPPPQAAGPRYGGSPYGGGYGEHEYDEEPARGRSRSRDDTAYRGATEAHENPFGDGHRENPFEDAAERSDLRGVSPRPVEMEGHPKNERRSMFREAM